LDDDRIKQVGELLSNDVSRNILKLLFKNIMTANDIAKEADISLPLVMYHLKKMQEANMVRVTNVGKTIKSKDIKRYTTTKFALVIVADSVKDKVKESKAIKRSFSGFYKFASIGIVSGAAWFASMFAQQREQEVMVGTPTEDFGEAPTEEASVVVPEDGIEVPLEEVPAEVVPPEVVPPEVVPPEVVPPEISEPALYPPDIVEILPADILWSTVIALGILVVGLIIERAVRSRKK